MPKFLIVFLFIVTTVATGIGVYTLPPDGGKGCVKEGGRGSASLIRTAECRTILG